MTVSLNHTIVVGRDKVQSATFLTEILGLPPHRMMDHWEIITRAYGSGGPAAKHPHPLLPRKR